MNPTTKSWAHSIVRTVAAGVVATAVSCAPALAQETIKIGILHSLTGTMAISETTLKDTMLMLIDQQNRRGGLLGKKLEPVVVDPQSDWPLFAKKTRELIDRHRVAVIFGCWTSASRKAVLPSIEDRNGLLFYPVQYEGQESSKNVFYTGAAPNQQAIPAIDYLMSAQGGAVERWVLAGTDYVYPRTTNKILKNYLRTSGVSKADIMVSYTPFGHSNWQGIVADIKQFGSRGKKTAVISTINGDANEPFYQELVAQGILAEEIPVMAFSVGEEELSGIDTAPLVGHMAAWNYFMSIDVEANQQFITRWKGYMGDWNRVTNDPMEAHYIGFNMWAKAVKKAGTTDIDTVRQAMYGITVPNLSGGHATMFTNHHISKPVFIGEIQRNGQFKVVWKTPGTVVGDAWTDLLPQSRMIVADWSKPISCGNFHINSGECRAQIH